MRVMKAAERFPKHRIVLVPEGKSGSFRTPINLSVREKLAPSAAGPFPCSGRAWNFFLVQREGRRYRLMQREGKPSPAYPNAGPALLLAVLFLWSLLDDAGGTKLSISTVWVLAISMASISSSETMR